MRDRGILMLLLVTGKEQRHLLTVCPIASVHRTAIGVQPGNITATLVRWHPPMNVTRLAQ